MSEPLIKPPTDYHRLIVYQKANLIYALNDYFINSSKLPFMRTKEQMDQAARSGKQNIIEGLNDFSTSAQSGLHLVNVARGSLLELKADYEDFLLRHNFEKWDFRDIKFKKAQELGKTKSTELDFFRHIFETRPPETNANIMLVLIGQAIYLIDRFSEKLQKDFVENGGFKEKLYHYRSNNRKKT